MNTPEQSVGDLAVALGFLIVYEKNYPPGRQEAYRCFVDSVIVLAHRAGVSREDAVRPFDVYREHAESVWSDLEK